MADLVECSCVKRRAAVLSEEERTPKRLKFMDPDLTVVVGGVEFYHYKVELSVISPFFHRMLSANMKESKEGRVEFPDMESNDWQEIYRFLDPGARRSKKDKLLQKLANDIADDDIECTALQKFGRMLQWFEYLELDSLANDCDKAVANDISTTYSELGYYLGHDQWSFFKSFPCPFVQDAVKECIKHEMRMTIQFLHRRHLLEDNTARDEHDEDLNKFLLDTQCGDEMWQHLLTLVIPSEAMLQENSKEKIVTSTFWDSLLQIRREDLDEFYE